MTVIEFPQPDNEPDFEEMIEILQGVLVENDLSVGESIVALAVTLHALIKLDAKDSVGKECEGLGAATFFLVNGLDGYYGDDDDGEGEEIVA